MRRVGIIILALIVGACERELGVDLPYQGDRLVLYGVLFPDRVVSLKLSKTVPATGTNLFGEGVTHATVSLFENDLFVENLIHTSEGVYTSANFKPKILNSYTVKVVAEGFPAIETAPEIIPDTLGVVRYDFSDTITSTFNEDYPARKLVLQFNDLPAGENFYNLEINGLYQNKYVAIQTFDIDRLDGLEDLCVARGNYNTYNIKDVCFENSAFTMNVGVETRGFLQADEPGSNAPTNERNCDKVAIKLRNVTPAYYEYQKSYYEPEGLLQAFSPPVVRYSNVRGGYGILAAGSEQVFNIRLK
jgi:hypothetical protein